MAVKSIIDIKINDEEFKRFNELFMKYQDALAKTPGEWNKVGDALQGSKITFEAIVALLLVQDDLARKRAADDRKSEESSRKSAGYWSSITRSSREFASNISSATRHIRKWIEVGAVFGSLLGVGGFFGLDRLAGTVSSGRRSALGLGVSYGTQQAFNLDYGRLVDPGSFLSGISEALRDPTKASALYGAGLTERDIQGKSTGQVAAAALNSLTQLAKRTPTEFLGTAWQSFGLGQFLSLQDFQRLKSTPASEKATLDQWFLKDRGTSALGLGGGTQLKWANFDRQLSKSGQLIQNAFVDGITGLIGPLGDLSKSFAEAIKTFLTNKDLKVWIKDFGEGIKWAAHEVGTKEFRDGITNAISDIKAFGNALAGFLGLFGVAPAKGTAGPPPIDYGHGVGGFFSSFKARAEANGIVPLGHGKSWAVIGDLGFKGTEKKYHLPAGLLWNTYGAESAYGTRLLSKKGAMGPFQFMPGTASDYGLLNPNDTQLSAEAAGRYYDHLLSRFNHDIFKAVAAYNWGEKNVASDIAKHGSKWRDYLPHETKDYLSKVLRGQGLAHGVTIKIQNETGANVVTSSNQVAK